MFISKYMLLPPVLLASILVICTTFFPCSCSLFLTAEASMYDASDSLKEDDKKENDLHDSEEKDDILSDDFDDPEEGDDILSDNFDDPEEGDDVLSDDFDDPEEDDDVLSDDINDPKEYDDMLSDDFEGPIEEDDHWEEDPDEEQKSDSPEEEKAEDWPTEGIASRLPVPDANLDTFFLICLAESQFDASIVISAEGFDRYVSACEAWGFDQEERYQSSEEEENLSSSFYALDSEGYKLNLKYFAETEEEGTLSISLHAPIPMTEIQWPDYALGLLLPPPPTSLGRIGGSPEIFLVSYLGEMPLDTYYAYLDACKNAGFDRDINETETGYSATDGDGIELTLNYEGGGVVYLRLFDPEQKWRSRGTGGTAEESDALTPEQTEPSNAPEEPAEPFESTADKGSFSSTDNSGKTFRAGTEGSIDSQTKDRLAENAVKNDNTILSSEAGDTPADSLSSAIPGAKSPQNIHDAKSTKQESRRTDASAQTMNTTAGQTASRPQNTAGKQTETTLPVSNAKNREIKASNQTGAGFSDSQSSDDQNALKLSKNAADRLKKQLFTGNMDWLKEGHEEFSLQKASTNHPPVPIASGSTAAVSSKPQNGIAGILAVLFTLSATLSGMIMKKHAIQRERFRDNGCM